MAQKANPNMIVKQDPGRNNDGTRRPSPGSRAFRGHPPVAQKSGFSFDSRMDSVRVIPPPKSLA